MDVTGWILILIAFELLMILFSIRSALVDLDAIAERRLIELLSKIENVERAVQHAAFDVSRYLNRSGEGQL